MIAELFTCGCLLSEQIDGVFSPQRFAACVGFFLRAFHSRYELRSCSARRTTPC